MIDNKRLTRVVKSVVMPHGWRVYDYDGFVARRSTTPPDSIVFTIHRNKQYGAVRIGREVFVGWTDPSGKRHPPITDDDLRELLTEEFTAVSRRAT